MSNNEDLIQIYEDKLSHLENKIEVIKIILAEERVSIDALVTALEKIADDKLIQLTKEYYLKTIWKYKKIANEAIEKTIQQKER